MRQDFSDQTVLKMPKIMHADMISFEAAGQLRADSFDALSYTFAEFEKMFREISFHILPWRRDDKNSMTLQQDGLPELINEAFVRRRGSFKSFQQCFKTLNIMRTRRNLGIICDHSKPINTQAQFKSIIMHVFRSAISEISLSVKASVPSGSGDDADSQWKSVDWLDMIIYFTADYCQTFLNIRFNLP